MNRGVTATMSLTPSTKTALLTVSSPNNWPVTCSDDTSLEVRRRNLIATTFLTMGNSNLEDQDKKKLEMDFVDEQLDVIGRGFLAQTLSCARCHDHKFDPIPTKDYYALAGILKSVEALTHANISKWVKVPLPVSDEMEANLKRHRKTVTAMENSVAKLKQRLGPKSGKRIGNVIAVEDLPGVIVDDTDARKVGHWKNSQSVKSYVGEGYCHDESTDKGKKTLSFLPRLPRDGRLRGPLRIQPRSQPLTRRTGHRLQR